MRIRSTLSPAARSCNTLISSAPSRLCARDSCAMPPGSVQHSCGALWCSGYVPLCLRERASHSILRQSLVEKASVRSAAATSSHRLSAHGCTMALAKFGGNSRSEVALSIAGTYRRDPCSEPSQVLTVAGACAWLDQDSSFAELL